MYYVCIGSEQQTQTPVTPPRATSSLESDFEKQFAALAIQGEEDSASAVADSREELPASDRANVKPQPQQNKASTAAKKKVAIPA